MENIHNSWKPLFDKYTFDIDQIYENDTVIYPAKEYLFKVFTLDLNEIRIVLLGQDPYHGPNQAHGLSFSVPIDTKIPPSLKNIFKELKLEFPERNYEYTHGLLDNWFYREKIFLLNSSLTVCEGKPGSHMKIWESFTNDVIEFISINNENCVFLLLGNFAKEKTKFIKNKNKIITEKHPSPLAQGFIGSNVFTRVETVLGNTVNWSN
jgi:uracil-DNA glycosylase